MNLATQYVNKKLLESVDYDNMITSFRDRV